MSYLDLKTIHVTCVVVSYALFFIRGVWMMRDPALLAQRWVRIVPHVNDTVLLASAIAMLVTIRLNPFSTGWLTAKLLGLIAYIGLGMFALRRGRTKRTRVTAWLAAQAVFFYIVAVALTKSPAPGLA
jgi:uncharacterized membrane protein SirB2